MIGWKPRKVYCTWTTYMVDREKVYRKRFDMMAVFCTKDQTVARIGNIVPLTRLGLEDIWDLAFEVGAFN